MKRAAPTLGAIAALAVAALYLAARRRRPRWTQPAGAQHRAGPLAVRTLGTGPPVVLLHGLTGSASFWGGAYAVLAEERQLIVPDLLGFGRSDRPEAGYGPDDHAGAIASALDAIGLTRPAVVGAHSLGTVVALRLATIRPDLVSSIVAFGPPLYPDEEAARAHIGSMSPMARLFVLPGRAARAVCAWMCDHRALAGRLSVLLNPSVPPTIAADAVQHSWPSYSETLQRCLLTGEPSTWFSTISCAIHLIAGRDDPVVDHDHLDALDRLHERVTVSRWAGDHRLPLTHTDDAIAVLRPAAASAPDDGGDEQRRQVR